MIGPKLDARSYAILILAAVGLLVGGTLIAQQTQSTVQSQLEVASATRQVAEATGRVADSNQQIALAIRELARSVGDVKNAIAAQGKDAPAAEPGTATPEQPAPAQQEGVFELR